MNRIEIENNKGLILTMTDSGMLSINYLGMDPVNNEKFVVPIKNLDNEKLQLETEKLKVIVDNYSKGVVSFPKYFLDVKVEVDPEIQYDENYNESIYSMNNSRKIKRSRVKFDLVFDGKIAENVKINILTPYNVVCDEPSVVIGDMTCPYSKIVNFRVLFAFFPITSIVKAHVTYENKCKFNIMI